MMDRLDRESDKQKFEIIQPIYSWFINTINKEAQKIIEQNKIPSKIYLKYPINNKENTMYSFRSYFGILKIIVDPDMKEILRVE